MSRGSRGPRQPGGGRQIAGPRFFPPPTREARGGEGRRAQRAGVGGKFAKKPPPTPDPPPPRRVAPWGEGRGRRGAHNVPGTADESRVRAARFLLSRIPAASYP